MKLVHSGQIFDKTHIPNFIKTVPVETELFHADRQTDRRMDRHDEAYSRFSQFCEST